jgi:hypothetical protein
MATPPDFTTGQVLTAAQMNAVGLWLVKTQTVGTTVSSVSVTDAFSADYENYLITYTGGSSSSAVVPIDVQMNGSTNAHFAVLNYNGYAGGSGVVASNNAVKWTHVGSSVGSVPNLFFSLQNPFLAKPTFLGGTYADATNTGNINGVQTQAVSFTGFTINPTSGTFTGGTVRVYGYRK